MANPVGPMGRERLMEFGAFVWLGAEGESRHCTTRSASPRFLASYFLFLLRSLSVQSVICSVTNLCSAGLRS